MVYVFIKVDPLPRSLSTLLWSLLIETSIMIFTHSITITDRLNNH